MRRSFLDGTDNSPRLRLLLFTAVLTAGAAAALFFGRYPQPGFTSPLQLSEDPLLRQILLNLRLPRILAAVLGGAVLGAAGMVFQMIFSNPLVEPGFLGVSQGAAFGAALSILFFPPAFLYLQLSAGFFGMLGLLLSYSLARRIHFGGWILRLILAGIAVSALFASALGILQYTADPFSELPEITFWLLGSLAGINWSRLWSITPVSLITLVILLGYRWRLNILSLTDRSAFSLGTRPGAEKLVILFFTAASTAAVISISGLIGWAGLIVPHIARRAVRTDTQYSLPGSMLIGAAYLLLCDTLARVMTAAEIPLGILTSAGGALLFLVILTRKRSGEYL